ncbi:uncharacterized protein LOC143234771 isoform X3 [Tachypleus tridentatus]|uniref:uncharacterized protein LOC143234771 isoform X3 n=1 Tax=Tachypleus tridentatus TaxID=6853 RepID=UPI003FD68242
MVFELEGSSSTAVIPIILTSVFKYLTPSDRLTASCVCRQWYYTSFDAKLLGDIALVLRDNAAAAFEVLKKSQRRFSHLVVKEVDILWDDQEFWTNVGQNLVRLDFHSCDISTHVFINILHKCPHLQVLGINGCNGLFISGTLFERMQDTGKLGAIMQNVKELNLASNRYLSDSLFSRIVKVLPNLERISLSGCQISFHPGIYRRFYPDGMKSVPSSAVFTFQTVMEFIEKRKFKLTSFNFGRTLIDNKTLTAVASLEGLQLEELYLSSCEQLSKSGIMLLCMNQPQLRVLDLSLIYQLTDQALIYVCDYLTNLRSLSLRRCHNLTDRSVKELSRLVNLETLDLSSCEKVTPAGLREALCFESHPKLHTINLSYCNVTDEIVCDFVYKLSNLTHLDLSSCLTLTDKSLHAVSCVLVSLHSLKLAWCKEITDRGLTGGKGIAPYLQLFQIPSRVAYRNICRNDQYREVQGSLCSGDNVCGHFPVSQTDHLVDTGQIGQFPPALTCLTGLRELDLCGCIHIGDVGLKGIKFVELRYLNLSLCQNITDVGLVIMSSYNPSLDTLILNQCHQVRQSTVIECHQVILSTVIKCHQVRQSTVIECHQVRQSTVIECHQVILSTVIKCHQVRQSTVIECHQVILSTVIECHQVRQSTVIECHQVILSTVIECHQVRQSTVIGCHQVILSTVIECHQVRQSTVIECHQVILSTVIGCHQVILSTVIKCHQVRQSTVIGCHQVRQSTVIGCRQVRQSTVIECRQVMTINCNRMSSGKTINCNRMSSGKTINCNRMSSGNTINCNRMSSGNTINCNKMSSGKTINCNRMSSGNDYQL